MWSYLYLLLSALSISAAFRGLSTVRMYVGVYVYLVNEHGIIEYILVLVAAAQYKQYQREKTLCSVVTSYDVQAIQHIHQIIAHQIVRKKGLSDSLKINRSVQYTPAAVLAVTAASRRCRPKQYIATRRIMSTTSSKAGRQSSACAYVRLCPKYAMRQDFCQLSTSGPLLTSVCMLSGGAYISQGFCGDAQRLFS